MSIILIGFMGAGKTTIAGLLDPNYIDTDQLISQKYKMSTANFFDKYGEASFRLEEEETLAELLPAERLVATGGGIIESLRNQWLLKQEKQVVYLKADFETIVDRLEADKSVRRSLFENSTREEFFAVYERRLSIYESLADLIVDTTNKNPEEVADEIRQQLKLY